MSRRTLYYEKLWHYQGATSTDPSENQLINGLTPPLKLDVMMFLFKDMILKLPFFKDLTAVVIEELVCVRRRKAIVVPLSALIMVGDMVLMASSKPLEICMM